MERKLSSLRRTPYVFVFACVLLIKSSNTLAQTTVQLFDSSVKASVSPIVDLNIKAPAKKSCSRKPTKKRSRYVLSATAQLASSSLSLSGGTGPATCDVEFPVRGALVISKKPRTKINFTGTLVRRQGTGTGAPLYDGVLVEQRDSKKKKSSGVLIVHVVALSVEESR